MGHCAPGRDVLPVFRAIGFGTLRGDDPAPVFGPLGETGRQPNGIWDEVSSLSQAERESIHRPDVVCGRRCRGASGRPTHQGVGRCALSLVRGAARVRRPDAGTVQQGVTSPYSCRNATTGSWVLLVQGRGGEGRGRPTSCSQKGPALKHRGQPGTDHGTRTNSLVCRGLMTPKCRRSVVRISVTPSRSAMATIVASTSPTSCSR